MRKKAASTLRVPKKKKAKKPGRPVEILSDKDLRRLAKKAVKR